MASRPLAPFPTSRADKPSFKKIAVFLVIFGKIVVDLSVQPSPISQPVSDANLGQPKRDLIARVLCAWQLTQLYTVSALSSCWLIVLLTAVIGYWSCRS